MMMNAVMENIMTRRTIRRFREQQICEGDEQAPKGKARNDGRIMRVG
ncbi:MAG: hypothetical protein HDR22_08675 [Lachnospiraceae bacterium]|nr:hypothetical protein [Lachnospiraceae bacterium]